MLTGDERPPVTPNRLGNDAMDEARTAHDAAQEANRRDLDNIDKTILYRYLVKFPRYFDQAHYC